LILITKPEDVIQQLKKSLATHFKMKDLAHYCLGVCIDQDEDHADMSVATSEAVPFVKHGLTEANTASTPAAANLNDKLEKDDGVIKRVQSLED
jgi:hypothetical protein